jgi:CTD small phosphatase-like protein 2
MTGKVLKAGFNVRPFTRECLEMVNKFFEVVVFTASHKWYADVILDYIDPDKTLI